MQNMLIQEYGQIKRIELQHNPYYCLSGSDIADRRVYEILSEKFELFEGVFGASDQALGLLESGIDFEKRILQIYQNCDSIGEFNKEFKALEKDFERKRNTKFKELKSLLIEEKDNKSLFDS